MGKIGPNDIEKINIFLIHIIHYMKIKTYILSACFFILTIPLWQIHAQAQANPISEKNIEFIYYPDFPDANSTWGSIGFNPVLIVFTWV